MGDRLPLMSALYYFSNLIARVFYFEIIDRKSKSGLYIFPRMEQKNVRPHYMLPVFSVEYGLNPTRPSSPFM